MLSDFLRKTGPPSHFACWKKDKPWARGIGRDGSNPYITRELTVEIPATCSLRSII